MEPLSEQPARHHEAAHHSFDITPPDAGIPQQPMDDHPVLSELYPESERPEHQVQRQGDQSRSNRLGDVVHEREGNQPNPQRGVCDASIQGRTHGNHAPHCPWFAAHLGVKGERQSASVRASQNSRIRRRFGDFLQLCASRAPIACRSGCLLRDKVKE